MLHFKSSPTMDFTFDSVISVFGVDQSYSYCNTSPGFEPLLMASYRGRLDSFVLTV